jgi:hypothetical protein
VIVPPTWEFTSGLENTEDRRSAGWHGDQHVRLRSAEVSDLHRHARPQSFATFFVISGAGQGLSISATQQS